MVNILDVIVYQFLDLAWLGSEPGNYGDNKDCALMLSYYEYKWMDLPCSENGHAVCEIPYVSLAL